MLGFLALAVLAAGAATVETTHPGGIDVTHPFGRGQDSTAPQAFAATSTATIARQTLVARTAVSGTLGYSGDYEVSGARGTFTALPAIGQVVKQGEVLYETDGVPVVLLNGAKPAYRDLAAGAKPSDVTGKDVQQLNAALVALGYASGHDLDPASDQFGPATKAGVMNLQKHLGVAATGVLPLGQVVFLPTAARITSVSAVLGGQAGAGGPALKATSTTRQVTVNLSAAQQTQVKAGDEVRITLPNGKTTPGTVATVGTVATTSATDAKSPPTITVLITLKDPEATGSLDQAPVQVAITTATAENALVVPVASLLAQAGGGYAVEVAGADGTHRLVPVTLGLFDDDQGMVQVTGTGLEAGQSVVVPSS
ncbi:MAG: peptidoglycan-binding protein [Catenulispora sp.]|nr:peptidoglycan-binding protein [Catenulispora sp.]